MAEGDGDSRTVETVVTYLEMTAPPAHFVPIPVNLKLALMRANPVPVHYYRYLYDVVGRDYVWVDRKKLSDDALTTALSAPGVEIFVAYAHGVPAGFFELDRPQADEVWLKYFGVVPDFHGRGLGKWLLWEALMEAWRSSPKCVRVETCTLDGPRALPLYQRMGFVPYERRSKLMELSV